MIDAFLRLKNESDQLVEGESADQGFERTIEIRDFSLGEKATGTAPPILPPATDGPVDVTNETAPIAELIEDTHSRFLAELKQAAAANLKRQQRTDIRRKTGGSFGNDEMSAKALVTEEVIKHAAEHETKDKGERLTFRIVKDVDSSSADLFQGYCATVTPVPNFNRSLMGEFTSAEITLRKMFAGVLKPYFVCTFQDVAISAFDLSFDSARAHVVETVTFKFVRYKMWYQTQDATGQAGVANPETSGSIGAKAT